MLRVRMKVVVTGLACLAPPALGQAPPPARDDGADISHLPAVVQWDVLAWRDRLESAACLKVVCDTDQVWERMDELDEHGKPIVVRRERFQAHSWMTPDTLWMVVFAYKDGSVDTTTPYTQVLWDRTTGVVRERYWFPQYGAYRVRRYEESNPYGPVDANVADCRGCIYATVLSSWLAGGQELELRSPSTKIMALMEVPNLAIVPADPGERGLWLDILRDELTRDSRDDAEKLYRRHDFALLSRDELGRSEVSQWRTVVMTDPDAGGMRATQITGVRSFEYTFFEETPAELLESISMFANELDEVLVEPDDSNSPAADSE